MHASLRPNATLAREKALSQGEELVIFWQGPRVDVEMLLNDGNRRTWLDPGDEAAQMCAMQVGGFEDQVHAPTDTLLHERVLGLGELDKALMFELCLIERYELHEL